MQAGNIMEVELSRVVPGDNPRKDFGDIDALAAAIEATGGRPVNPIVVVLDGGAYRLIDGERRWRALRKLHGEDGTTEALVFPSYDAAEEAVAMVATDSKKGLSEQEAARGFQRMLLLDVPTERVAKALRRPRADIEKARSVAESAGEQATLDQMIAAAEFEGKDRLAVLSADPDKYQAKAESIRRNLAMKEQDERFAATFAELGIKVEKTAPKGWRSVHVCYNPENVGSVAAANAGVELRVWPAEWNKHYWVLGVESKEAAESEEEAAMRKEQERQQAAVVQLREALTRFVVSEPLLPFMCAAMGALRLELSDRIWDYRSLTEDLVENYGEEAARRLMGGRASLYEVARFLKATTCNWFEWVPPLLEAAVRDGFQPSEEDQWLLASAVAKRERIAAEGAE